VLKYLGDGSQVAQYLLDIYTPDGSFLAQTDGLPAGGIAVNLWRTLYTLDFQQIVKPGGADGTVGERLDPHHAIIIDLVVETPNADGYRRYLTQRHKLSVL
jgi:hypothetical protein